MQTITRKLWFSAGHRVFEHEGECANIHGHNYICQITATAENLDTLGRVIDFKVLKNKIDPWLQKNWDHAFLWYDADPVGQLLYGEGSACTSARHMMVLQDVRKMRNFRCMFNPTAERMSAYLLNTVCPEVLKGTGVTVISVQLFETENCVATTTLDLAVIGSDDETIPTHQKVAETTL